MGLHIACLIHFANNLLYNQLSVSWFWAVARGGGKGKREQKKKVEKKEVNSFNKPNDISEEKFL